MGKRKEKVSAEKKVSSKLVLEPLMLQSPAVKAMKEALKNPIYIPEEQLPKRGTFCVFDGPTPKERRCMEADFVAQHPDAIITSIPEKAYHDPEAAKQLQYDMAEIVATMSPVYKHGKKFKENSGRKPDSFTKLLESIFTDYHNQNGCFPNYRKVLKTLKQQMGDGFIHTVEDDGTIEWGEKGNTSLATLKNKLSNIRKKIKSR